jgi:hypothetical protein
LVFLARYAEVFGAGFTACGKTQIFVIPRRAARRGISLFLGLNQKGFPHFVRNEKINYFFRSLFRARVPNQVYGGLSEAAFRRAS